MEENITVEIAPKPAGIRIGEEDKFLLASTAKWSKFISIVMFVCLGLGMLFIMFWMIATAVAGFSMYDMGMYGAMAGSLYTAIMWPMMIFCLLIYIVQMLPAVYLYRFASKTKEAVASADEAAMTEAFRNLRGSVKTTGIILIVSIGFIVLFSGAAVIIGFAMMP